ncbi:MAG: glycosyltransferase family 2 protein [Candidatus Kaiserbacteria bacterium]|nr:glycosyltransferase family 2 protein [Candidatus Kaiserbacteria bacterium]
MSHSEKIVAVIPAYNEAKTINAVVRGLLPHVTEVVVIDDCSKDATSEEAHTAGATVIRHEHNQGYDQTLNDGFTEAVRRGADIIITFDADGEHDANDVPRIVAPILAGRADMVAGQRPRILHIAEKIFAVYTAARYGLKDPLCGLKAYRRSVYDSIGFFDSVSSIGTELMLRGVKKGYRLALVPIALHTRVGNSSRFYAQSVRANLKILRAMQRILFI